MSWDELVEMIRRNERRAFDAALLQRPDGRAYPHLTGFTPVHYIVAFAASNFYDALGQLPLEQTRAQTLIKLPSKHNFVLESGSSPLHVAIVFDNLTAARLLLPEGISRNLYLESPLHLSAYFRHDTALAVQVHLLSDDLLEVCYADANTCSFIQLACLYGRCDALSALAACVEAALDDGRLDVLKEVARQFFTLDADFLDPLQLCRKPVQYSWFGALRGEKQRSYAVVEAVQQMIIASADLIGVQEYLNYYFMHRRIAFSGARVASAESPDDGVKLII